MSELFTYQGRIGRLGYFGRSVGVFLAAAVAAGILFGIAFAIDNYAIFVLLLPIWAAAVILQVMLSIRRLHDIDLSGKWYLPGLLAMMVGGQMVYSAEPMAALIGTILYFGPTWFLLLMPGTKGPNRFGPAPVEASEAPALSPT